LSDHVNRHNHKEAGNFGEHRGVDNPEALHAAHSKRRVEHGLWILVAADLAGTRGMMAPGTVLHEAVYASVRLEIDALHDVRMELQLSRSGEQLVDEAHTVAHRLKIFQGVGRVRTLPVALEVLEVDCRRVERLMRPERDLPAGTGVSFEQEPGPFVMGRGDGILRPAGVVACKGPRHAEDEEVRLVLLRDARTRGKAKDRAVGGIKPLTLAAPLLKKRIPPGLPCRRTMERGVVEQTKRFCGPGDNADLVAILQVLPDAGKVEANRDVDFRPF